MAFVLVATVLPGLATSGVASAAGPSVPLLTIPSTPVTKQNVDPRQPDAATKAALKPGQGPTNGPDGAGTSTATSLAPSSIWDVSTQTGDFTTGYPLRMPPVPGGLAPNLALSYRSSAVDGHTSSTNNQPSWVGEGWDLSPGFVERTYGACAEDDEGSFKPAQIGDLCWRSDNAIAVFDGGGGMLIRDGDTAVWRAKNDNGARIERIVNPNHRNGDNDGEHWKITTLDGTQYWFGSQLDSESTWTVPVFGDDSNEPCNKPGSFDASHCKQAWRWNLDKVIDPNGNVIRYFYKPESNSYGMNLKDTAASYTRGGTLWKVQYGLNERVTSLAGAEVEFGVADRCVPGSSCTLDKANWVNWQDTPLDSRCAAATCPQQYSPTFWSSKRLDTITTRVRKDSSYSDVDRWTLDQIYPDPGSGERAALWLKGIKHTGLVGGSLELPSLTFEGAAYPNRVYKPTGDGIGPLNRFRLTGIVSETGGVTSITYASQCRDDLLPANAETNTMWCFPVTWTKKNLAERTDYFHKYVVAQVIQSDRLYIGENRSSTGPEQVTSYEYLTGAAWRWDQSEFTNDKKKSWNDFRGFGTVRVRVGKAGDPSGPVTMTEQRFHRGMDGDRLNRDGGTKPQVKLVDSEGTERIDHDWLSGIGYETRAYEREGTSTDPDPPLMSKTLTDQRWWGPLATRGPFKSYRVKTIAERGFTALKSGGWRKTRTDTTYDDTHGLPVATNDLGDADAPSDDQCTRTKYAANSLILDLVSTVETVSVSCATTPQFPDNAVSNTHTSYDDRGNPTKVQVAKDWPVADRPAYVTASTATYDEHGRVTEATDAAGSRTTTAYTPRTGGPVAEVVTTGPPTPAVPAGMVMRTKLDTASGQPTLITDANNQTTEIAYDALGRKTEVWLANRPKATNTRGNVQFSYLIRSDAPSVVTTTAIGPNGNYTSGKVIYDGLLRPRQRQAPAPGGGRVLTDTRYDSQGRVWKSTQPYFNNADIDDNLWVADDAQVPGLSRTEYDTAGRAKASVYQAGAVDKWRTTIEYGGDRVHVTPPAGGTVTTTISDARGRTTELRQYQGATPSGAYDATVYRYNRAGQLSEVVAPGNITWKYGYDLRGNKIRSEDPDSGVATTTYDDAGRTKTTTDAGNVTLAFKYDSLSRKTELHRNDVNGPKLAQWVYDTAGNGKGKLATSTRYVGTLEYTASVGSYTPLYQPNDTTVTIPAAPGLGLLAGSYTWFGTYGQDGASLSNETYPAAGGLPAETVNYVQDNAGRLLSSSGGFDGETVELVTQTNYTRYGETERVQFGEGTKRVWLSYYFNSNTRRPERSIVDSETTVPKQSDVQYTHDDAGFATAIAEAAPGQTDTQCFRNDYLGRMTEAWTPKSGCATAPSILELGGAAPYWHSYQFDKSGNREKEIRHTAAGDSTTTYTYPGPGQPQPHTLRSVTGGGRAESYTYNAAGYTTGRTRAGVNETLNWDAEGHLESVVNASGKTSYVYDADGGRLLRKDPGGTTLYLGNQEVRLSAAGGNPVATRYYTYGGKAIAVRTGGELTWLAGEQRATQVSIDSQTMQVTRRRQLPFGESRGEAPSFWPDERGFVGGTRDSSTGLTHLGAREYDTATGRFISVDPLLDLSNPQQMNGYAYSNNNPITFSDPTGLILSDCGDSSGSCKGLDPWTGEPAPSQPAGGSNPGQSGGRNGGTYRNNPSYKQPGGGVPLRTGCGGRGYCAPNGTPPVTSPKPPPPNELDECIAQMQKSDDINASKCSGLTRAGRDEHRDALELCSELPFVGVLCAVRNAADNIEDGDWGSAIGSLLAIVPGPSPRGGKGKGKDYCSFDGDTEVLMADGTTKPISEIKAGDQVLATDPETGEKGPRTVEAVFVHEDTLIDLRTEDGATVTTTEDHKFWNATDKRWEPVNQFDPGDSLLTATGEHTRIVGLLPGTEYVTLAYNLTIDDLHTYHVQVGDAAILVHNDCPKFKLNEFYEDSITLSNGITYNVGGYVEAVGDKLQVRAAVLEPPKGVDWDEAVGQLGMRGAAEVRGLLRARWGAQAAAQGYTHLRVMGTRVTGPKFGHMFDTGWMKVGE